MRQRTGKVRAAIAVGAAALIGAALGARAADEEKREPPKPTPQHEALARAEGEWDARVEISMGAPGTPPQVSNGVETSHLCCGGLWLVTEFHSAPGSPPFEGHGIRGYEPSTKRYTATWVDSDLTTPMVSEGTYDAAGKTLTMTGSTTSKGKTLRWRTVEVWKDDDTRQSTMFMRGPDGKDTPSLNITYTRRK